MKSFKNLFEQKKFYKRKEIIEWCLKNVDDFDIHDENDAVHTPSDNEFQILEMSQIVRRGSKYNLEIVTQDTELPFHFEAQYGEVIVRAPNLQKLSIRDSFTGSFVLSLCLNNCNSLNCENLDYKIGMIIKFERMYKIEPQHLKNIYFSEVHFEFCRDPKIYDFSNYEHSLIAHLDICKTAKYDFSNVSQLIENNNIGITAVALYTNYVYNSKLCEIVNKYVAKKNKSEHIMDFTVEMLDSGFEDML